MGSNFQLYKAILIVIVSLFVTSCSLPDWFHSEPPAKTEPTVTADQNLSKPSGWSYSEQWQLEGVTPPVVDISDQAMTLSGQCSFTPELVGALQQHRKGVLLPVIEIAGDFTFAPDLEASANLYQSLKQSLRLSGVGNSLELYQTILAGVEHSCPPKLNRDVDGCRFKKWMSFAGLGGSDSVYDFDRIARWYEKHKSIDFLVMNSAGLYNSKAMFSSRYSKHSRVLKRFGVSR